MVIIDKKGTLTSFSESSDVVLELGCGDRKRHADAVGIDMLDYDCVDIVGDIFDVLSKFPESSVSAVYSYHFVEHLSDLDAFMDEMARILKPGASLNTVVPHFSNPYFYSDYTHKMFFGLYTFCYFSHGGFFSRQTPTYQRRLKFSIKKVELVFKSTKPFYLRHIFKKLLGKLFNISNYTKELYEENLCYLFPCYEIHYHLIRISTEK